MATLDDGSSIEVHLGDRTPAGNTWYLGLPGQRIVYAVWTNHGNHYYYTVADMRGDELPAINGEALNYLRLQGPAIATLEIVETNPLDTRFADLLTRLAVIQPYAFPRAIDSEEFANVLAAVAAPRIDRIVSDDPEAAADYGLAPPRFEVLARDAAGAEVALRFGDERDGEIFFQVAGRATVYAMQRSRAGVLDLQPFALVDKFVLILNIEKVDAIEIVHPAAPTCCPSNAPARATTWWRASPSTARRWRTSRSASCTNSSSVCSAMRNCRRQSSLQCWLHSPRWASPTA